MEQHELQLLEKYAENDAELKELWNEHILYEKQLEKLESKSFLTPQEQQLVKQLKKQKLDGKTKLHALVEKYRAQEGK